MEISSRTGIINTCGSWRPLDALEEPSTMFDTPLQYCDMLNTFESFRGSPTYFGATECGLGQSTVDYSCDAMSSKVMALQENGGGAEWVEIGRLGIERYYPMVVEVPAEFCKKEGGSDNGNNGDNGNSGTSINDSVLPFFISTIISCYFF